MDKKEIRDLRKKKGYKYKEPGNKRKKDFRKQVRPWARKWLKSGHPWDGSKSYGGFGGGITKVMSNADRRKMGIEQDETQPDYKEKKWTKPQNKLLKFLNRMKAFFQ